MTQSPKEFYVGYSPKAPASLSRLIRAVVAALGVVASAIALVLVFGQTPFAASAFEYGQYRDYEGVLEEWPYPALVTADSRFLLVGSGKFGVAAAVKGMEGSVVHLKGSLIRRGPDMALEVLPGSLQMKLTAARAPARSTSDLGRVTLVGEIVDSKCYLGVMNPGNGKVHRDCAARCISGGIPPAFLVRDSSGESRVLLLTGADGRSLHQEVLDFVAEPVQISGQLVRAGSALILKAEPRDFHRIPAVE